MNSVYPEEPRKMDVLSHLEELRWRIIIVVGAFGVASIAAFSFGDRVMVLVRAPALPYVQNLIFISPSEAFLAYIKVSLLSGFIVTFPLILYQVGSFIMPAVPAKDRSRILVWLLFALLLFAGGICFSYFIAIPAALKFLISFGSKIAIPQITIGKYISFFGALMLVGGSIFEIPIVIAIGADVGIVNSRFLRRKRPMAVLVILITAAVITPTQDMINMLIFAVPMIILYEIGISLAKFIEKHTNKPQ